MPGTGVPVSETTSTFDPGENGRRAAAKRWSSASQADKDAATSHMRAALSARAIERARQQASILGIHLDFEEAEAAGAALLKHEQRVRAQHARVTAAATRAMRKRHSDERWAIAQAERYAASTSSVPDRLPLADMLTALRDELEAPDGFQRSRYLRRLQAVLRNARPLVPPDAPEFPAADHAAK